MRLAAVRRIGAFVAAGVVAGSGAVAVSPARASSVIAQMSAHGAASEAYRPYDSVGNLTGVTTGTTVSSYQYNDADQLVSVSAGPGQGTYEYDAAGQLIKDPTRSYQYDVAGRLLAVNTPSAAVSWTYNPDGTRASRTVSTDQGPETTNFLWDTTTGLPTLVAETDQDGNLLRRYDYGPAGAEAVTEMAGDSPTTRYVHADALGSIDTVTSSAGVVTESTRYSPWGEVTSRQTAGTSPATALGFTGQPLDQATGLLDLSARMYDPATARFTTPDPLGVSASNPAVSRYAYVEDQPTSLVDPSGLRGFDPAQVCPGWVHWLSPACSAFQRLSPTGQGIVAAGGEIIPLIITGPEGIITKGGEKLAAREAVEIAANHGDDLIRLSTKESWANLKTLDDHFARHGADFGATSADDYARMGSEFFQRGGAQHLPTKIAPDGTIRMYDPATNTFGSFAPNGMTKTLFKPTSPDYWSRQPGVLQ